MVPTFTVVKSIVNSIAGISLAPSGIVFAIESKFQFGIGVPTAFAGPYIKLNADVGITNGSALSAVIPRCVGATLDGKIAGVGLSVSSKAAAVLKKVLGPKTKITADLEQQKSFVKKSQTIPENITCTGS
ncbi:hypothetical protein [Micromonospora sp. WMMD812]|uniref:hypothetical protein n=1 Tax=Micromonospora sp. WMMD812 TaxID=3015152 RepID=UPI00248D2A91|nr:hypothetical protein [Micromonospora sp. WMMD812]WBB70095.1 hypothetical protein O7603_12325 [Micromonospora sp. WMMD812]